MKWSLVLVLTAVLVVSPGLSIPDPDKSRLTVQLPSKLINLNDAMNIPVSLISNLGVLTKFCGDIEFRLFSKGGDVNINLILLTIGKENTHIRSCTDTQKSKSCIAGPPGQTGESVLACKESSAFWISWDVKGQVKVGSGLEVGKDVKVTSTEVTGGYNINYMTVKKGGTGSSLFSFLYDRSQASTDAMTLSVDEDTAVHSAIASLGPPWNCYDYQWEVYRRGMVKEGKVVASINSSPNTNINNISLVQPLDYENNTHHNFTFHCKKAGAYTKVHVTVEVKDVNDCKPNLAKDGALKVTEELPVGSRVGPWIRASDQDTGDTLTYTLTGKHSNLFKMDAKTGHVTVAGRIDREKQKKLNLGVKVTDAAGHEAAATFNVTVLDINDNQPVFKKRLHRFDLSFNYREETVTTFTVEDLDDGPGVCSCKLEIVSGNENKVFSLEGHDLKADLQQLMDLNILDKQNWQFLLTVTLRERAPRGPALNDTAFVFITVDKPPQVKTYPKIHYKFTTPEFKDVLVKEVKVPKKIKRGNGVGFTAKFVNAKADKLESGHQEYHFRSDIECQGGVKASDFFRVHPKTGVVYVVRNDTWTCNKFKMSLYLADYMELTKTFFANLTILVESQNIKAPVTTPQFLSKTLPCHPYPGHKVAKLTVKDGDSTKTKFKVTQVSETIFKYKIKMSKNILSLEIDKGEKPWSKPFQSDLVKLNILDDGTPPLTGVAIVAITTGCVSPSSNSSTTETRRRRRDVSMATEQGKGQSQSSRHREEREVFQSRNPSEFVHLTDHVTYPPRQGLLPFLFFTLSLSLVVNIVFISNIIVRMLNCQR